MKHMRVAVGVAALAVLAMAGDNASATTVARTLAYGACKADGGTWIEWNGAIYNDSASTMLIDCAVPVSFNNNDEKVFTIFTSYHDQSPAQILCESRVADWFDGSILFTGGNRLSSNGVGRAIWNTSPGHIGQAYVACWVPAKSGSARSGILGLQVVYGS
jgi:hypothetical protein